MREILFRGKLANGEWSYGNLKVSRKGVAIITPDETVIGSYGRVDPETVGQYTGMKDKNGEKIFEGDIVSFTRINGLGYITDRIGEVRYYDALPLFYIMATTGDAWDWPYCDDITVIGNSYDNPELLSEEETPDVCGCTDMKCTYCGPGPCNNRR